MRQKGKQAYGTKIIPNMKRLYLHQFVISLSLLVSTNSFADNTVKVNGIAYRLLPDNRATVAYDSYQLDGEISIPQSIQANAKEYNIVAIEQGAFRQCDFTTISLPSSIKEIGNMAFADCSSLLSISLPDGIEKIGDSTFDGCTSLENIDIPLTVKSIGMWAFKNCLSLAAIVLPNGLEEIGDAAFENCQKLRLLSIPNSVKEVGNFAFSGCSSLRHVTLPSSLNSLNYGIIKGCDLNTELTVPASVTSMNDLGQGAKLRSIYILGDTIYDGLKTQSLYNGKRISIYLKRSVYDRGIYQNDTSWTKKFAFGYTIPLNMKASYVNVEQGNGSTRKVNYISLCRDFDVDFSDSEVTDPSCKAFFAADITFDGKEVAMRQLDYIPAEDTYTGVIIEGSPNAEYFYKIGEGATSKEDVKTDNLLKGVHTERMVTQRENDNITGERRTNYGLKDNLFKQFNQDGIMSYNKAYLSIPDFISNAKVFSLSFENLDGTTHVVKAESIMDMLKDDYHNLNGQSVDKNYKGIVITNKQKFINH